MQDAAQDSGRHDSATHRGTQGTGMGGAMHGTGHELSWAGGVHCLARMGERRVRGMVHPRNVNGGSAIPRYEERRALVRNPGLAPPLGARLGRGSGGGGSMCTLIGESKFRVMLYLGG